MNTDNPIFSLRRLLWAASGVALVTILAACGGSVACHECVVSAKLGNSTGFTVGPAGGTFGIVGGVHMVVEASVNDATPVPGAEVSVFTNGTMFFDSGGVDPAGDGRFLRTTVDDHGSIRVFPFITIGACSAQEILDKTTKIFTLGVTVGTANNDAVANFDFNQKCA